MGQVTPFCSKCVVIIYDIWGEGSGPQFFMEKTLIFSQVMGQKYPQNTNYSILYGHTFLTMGIQETVIYRLV